MGAPGRMGARRASAKAEQTGGRARCINIGIAGAGSAAWLAPTGSAAGERARLNPAEMRPAGESGRFTTRGGDRGAAGTETGLPLPDRALMVHRKPAIAVGRSLTHDSIGAVSRGRGRTAEASQDHRGALSGGRRRASRTASSGLAPAAGFAGSIRLGARPARPRSGLGGSRFIAGTASRQEQCQRQAGGVIAADCNAGRGCGSGKFTSATCAHSFGARNSAGGAGSAGSAARHVGAAPAEGAHRRARGAGAATKNRPQRCGSGAVAAERPFCGARGWIASRSRAKASFS